MCVFDISEIDQIKEIYSLGEGLGGIINVEEWTQLSPSSWYHFGKQIGLTSRIVILYNSHVRSTLKMDSAT